MYHPINNLTVSEGDGIIKVCTLLVADAHLQKDVSMLLSTKDGTGTIALCSNAKIRKNLYL